MKPRKSQRPVFPQFGDDDHDQRFKLIVREFASSLYELFWPEYARLFDFTQLEWLDQEAFPDPPRGKRRSLDLVGRLKLKEKLEVRPGKWTDSLVAVLHIEVEARSSAGRLRQQMFRYFAWLRQKYDVPILPAAIYLKVAMQGVGIDSYEEQFGNLNVVRYNYLYVGLPGLAATDYLKAASPLGAALSALMQVPAAQRVWHRAMALKQVLESRENEYRKYLLSECVQNYLPLRSNAEQEEFAELTNEKEFEEVKKVATTWYGQGVEEGQLKLAMRVLELRFGSVPKKVQQQLAALSAEELAAVLDRSHHVEKLRDALPDMK